MSTGKVLMLYMTMSDLMRPGYRGECDSLDCDSDGIIGDINYDNGEEYNILLVSKKSYDIIEGADLFFDKGMLLENIYVDIDLYHLNEGSLIEIGETLFKVTKVCHAYNYLYKYAPELPDLIQGNRGLFVSPVEYGRIEVGDSLKILKET